MNVRKLALVTAVMLTSLPAFAKTYYGGFEDAISGDYDYNDIVFTVSGNGLALNTTDGHWYNKPALGVNGTPFWNNASYDGGNRNVGFCIYGGGDCGAGFSAGAQYLASNNLTKTGSASDVTFSLGAKQSVTVNLAMEITSYKDSFGYYNLSDPSKIYWLSTPGQTGIFSFAPTGTFGIVAENGVNQVFHSQSNLDGLKDSVSHLAFFGDAAVAPEPSALGLMASGFIVVGALFRRKAKV